MFQKQRKEKNEMNYPKTYFDNIWPPAYCNWWQCWTSCTASGRCGHDGCCWIMSWWEIFMMEQLLCIVKFQFWYRISVHIHLWVFLGNKFRFFYFIYKFLIVLFLVVFYFDSNVLECTRVLFLIFALAALFAFFFLKYVFPLESFCFVLMSFC